MWEKVELSGLVETTARCKITGNQLPCGAPTILASFQNFRAFLVFSLKLLLLFYVKFNQRILAIWM